MTLHQKAAYISPHVWEVIASALRPNRIVSKWRLRALVEEHYDALVRDDYARIWTIEAELMSLPLAS